MNDIPGTATIGQMATEPPLDLSLARVERRIAAHEPNPPRIRDARRAAVACVLRYRRAAPDVLLMRRAERPGDRWSGQVSFPGGREDESDADLQATAIRETHEELGVDLRSHARYIGRLDTIRARSLGTPQALTVTPFVFVQQREFTLRLNYEASDAFWLPLDEAAAGTLSSHYEYKGGPPDAMRLPCWLYRDHMVWGMTYGMLEHLLAIIRG
jgi:8-oxo-dGTP pyrophosphatase MutT (NUDIX family)